MPSQGSDLQPCPLWWFFCVCIFSWLEGVGLCFCRPFCIFERCLYSNPESCSSKQARNQLSAWLWFLMVVTLDHRAVFVVLAIKCTNEGRLYFFYLYHFTMLSIFLYWNFYVVQQYWNLYFLNSAFHQIF